MKNNHDCIIGGIEMATVLFIKGTPQSENQSRSMIVARAFIEEYKKANPTDEVVELDLYNMDVPLIDADVLNGWNKLRSGETLTNAESQKVGAINVLTDQFVEADKYIVQSSMWNLGIQPLLKAYFDTAMIVGRTFKYTAEGPVGLMQGKKAIHIHGSGGVYSNTTGLEHADSYVTGVLGFMGMEVLPSLLVEGIDYNPDQKDEILATVTEKAEAVAKQF